ncbi:unnamed protein product [Linum trigynum]|uniref:Uncharacterized protein n=1 Tax=Linum trigynum TaxID=586398 RepID=A0AAV2GNM0_9ROSI
MSCIGYWASWMMDPIMPLCGDLGGLGCSFLVSADAPRIFSALGPAKVSCWPISNRPILSSFLLWDSHSSFQLGSPSLTTSDDWMAFVVASRSIASLRGELFASFSCSLYHCLPSCSMKLLEDTPPLQSPEPKWAGHLHSIVSGGQSQMG